MARKYDERFDELTGLVKKVAGRVDEMQLEMRDMRKENVGLHTGLGDLRSEVRASTDLQSARFDTLSRSIRTISARYEELIPKVIDIRKDVIRISETQLDQASKISELMSRLETVDQRLSVLGERTAQTNSEVKEIRKSLDSLIKPALDGQALWANIEHIEERLARIEEKVS